MTRERLISHSQTVLGVAVMVTTAGILFSMALSSVAFVFAALAFFVLAILDRRTAVQSTGIDWFIAAWIAAVLLMVVFATHSLSALNGSRRLLLLLILLFVPLAFSTSRSLRLFLLVLVIAAGLHSLAGIAQHLSGSEERLGFFQHYMTGGGVRMLLLLLLFLPLLFDSRTPRRERLIIAASVSVMLIALVLTMTRSSWLGFGAGVVFIGIMRFRMLIPIITVSVIVLFLVAPQQYRDRLTLMFRTEKAEVIQNEQNQAVVRSNQSRLRMWSTGWQMFLDHPIVGIGDGEMHTMYREYVPDAFKDEGGHLHNTYVHVLATHGAVGFLAMVALFGALGWREWRIWKDQQGNEISVVALGAMAAFVGFLINGMAEYNFGDHEILLLLWLTLGLVNAAVRADFRWNATVQENV